MATDVADDLAHVAVVGVAELVLGRSQQTDDPASRGVSDRLAVALGTPADAPRLLRLEPGLELVGLEVDGLLELERDSLELFGTHR
jgi:hypothetical protein